MVLTIIWFVSFPMIFFRRTPLCYFCTSPPPPVSLNVVVLWNLSSLSAIQMTELTSEFDWWLLACLFCTCTYFKPYFHSLLVKHSPFPTLHTPICDTVHLRVRLGGGGAIAWQHLHAHICALFYAIRRTTCYLRRWLRLRRRRRLPPARTRLERCVRVCVLFPPSIPQ